MDYNGENNVSDCEHKSLVEIVEELPMSEYYVDDSIEYFEDEFAQDTYGKRTSPDSSHHHHHYYHHYYDDDYSWRHNTTDFDDIDDLPDLTQIIMLLLLWGFILFCEYSCT